MSHHSFAPTFHHSSVRLYSAIAQKPKEFGPSLPGIDFERNRAQACPCSVSLTLLNRNDAIKPGQANREHSPFVTVNGRRSIRHLLEPLAALEGIEAEMLQFESDGEQHGIPRFVFRGPNSSDPIRLGIFAAIHGDEPAGALALVEFLRDLQAQPALAENYNIWAYPVCNPTGFEDNTRASRQGRDLNRQFWKSSKEAEVQLLEHELCTRHLHGIIQLHADDTSDGIYGFVRGATLTDELLRPALEAAAKVLPLNRSPLIDGFAAQDGIIYDQYEGVLAAPTEVTPIPFEIVFETPQLAPLELQAKAFDIFLHTVLAEYRRLISFAQNI
ncbi:MAG TPA: succinylglutamate desuccinylase/aspartoacylase family protein [Verrucomicrobiae bacterium]|nr:succinylglutamate desuccinylase/aspartoacylase family protein [Verrucomicrobiae bacterium]